MRPFIVVNKTLLKFLGFHNLTSFCTHKNQDQNSNLHMIMHKLKAYAERTKQLEQNLIDQSLESTKVLINPEKARMEINSMAAIVAKYEEMSAVLKNIQDLNQMQSQTTDQDQKALLDEEFELLKSKIRELKDDAISLLVPPDLYDDCQQVNLEFRAAAGGSESSLFVEDFSNMIISYCGSMGWRVNVVSSIRDSTTDGYRSLNIKVQGEDVYKNLKCQSGVHKVIRVPETQSKGRLHSSTISFVVMPSVPFDFSINDRDIRYEYTKSSGPGGQSVNKTESACRATHVPTGMSVFIQEDRSQDKNRKRATEILKQRLFEIEYKKNVEQESRKRKSQMGTMDRSEKIRTYNYPQDRITDHRTNLTLFGIEAMMSGQYLQKFIDAYQQKLYNEKLSQLMEQLSLNNSKMMQIL